MSIINSEYTNLSIVLLSLIRNKTANHGYNISNWIRGSGLNCQHQQIYRQLKGLTKEGLVDVEIEVLDGKPDRKIYSITKKGKQVLSQLRVDHKSKITPFEVACTVGDRSYINDARYWLNRQINEVKSLQESPVSASHTMLEAKAKLLVAQLKIVEKLAA